MHRCYKQCKPEIGYHHHAGESYPNEMVKHLHNLENTIGKIKVAENLAPNPDVYQIKDVIECGEYKVILVHYPNCTNYGGNKCLVAKCSMLDLLKLKRLDPHFTEVTPLDGIEIIARFPPSAVGIEMAKSLAILLQDGKLI